jgi:hypothetical protein
MSGQLHTAAALSPEKAPPRYTLGPRVCLDDMKWKFFTLLGLEPRPLSRPSLSQSLKQNWEQIIDSWITKWTLWFKKRIETSMKELETAVTVSNARNRWVSGLRPLLGIPETRKHTGPVCIHRWEKGNAPCPCGLSELILNRKFAEYPNCDCGWVQVSHDLITGMICILLQTVTLALSSV